MSQRAVVIVSLRHIHIYCCIISLTLAGTGDFGDLGDMGLLMSRRDRASETLVLVDVKEFEECEEIPLSPAVLMMSLSILQRSSSRASRSTSGLSAMR